jgi:hypothetical protein
LINKVGSGVFALPSVAENHRFCLMATEDSDPAFRAHLLVRLEQSLASVICDGTRHFLRAISAAKLDGFLEALGELFTGSTAGDVRFHVTACSRRKLHIQIFGEQGKHLFAVLIVLMR